MNVIVNEVGGRRMRDTPVKELENVELHGVKLFSLVEIGGSKCESNLRCTLKHFNRRQVVVQFFKLGYTIGGKTRLILKPIILKVL